MIYKFNIDELDHFTGENGETRRFSLLARDLSFYT